MNAKCEAIEFVPPWVAVGQYADNLTRELQREVTDRHILWRRTVRPLAQRSDCDDVLFEVEGPVMIYAVVHLTWAGEPGNDPLCPGTVVFGSFDEWVREGMMRDHHDFMEGE